MYEKVFAVVLISRSYAVSADRLPGRKSGDNAYDYRAYYSGHRRADHHAAASVRRHGRGRDGRLRAGKAGLSRDGV